MKTKPVYLYGVSASLFFLSAALISFQLMLMRMMSVTSYHHFSYLVISTALLGFGTSGTFLTFFYNYMKTHAHRSLSILYLLLVVSIPLCYSAATSVSIDIRYLFYSMEEVSNLTWYIFLLFIPFLLGAIIIGFKLTYYKEHVPLLYGANLAGSGAGGVAAIGLMFIFPASQLPNTVTIFVFAGMVCWLAASGYYRYQKLFSASTVALSFFVVLYSLMVQPSVDADSYKSISHFQQLENQGDAEKIAVQHGPRGQIDIFSSSTIHKTLFAGITADTIPPEQLAILLDGHQTGTIFKAQSTKETRILDFTPQSLAYRLTEKPKVLLLGETGDANVWLANRFNASEITIVQTNPQLLSLLEGPLANVNGSLYYEKHINVVNQHPRLFLEQNTEHFDIIHLVQAESQPSFSHGIQGMRENYLLTKESIQKALMRLTDSGFLTITRGMQEPPRDNIKIFALLAEAAESAGYPSPGKHLLQSKNYLAVNTLFSNRKLGQNALDRYKEFTNRLAMDIIYPQELASSSKDQSHALSDSRNDTAYYQYAAGQILRTGRNSFYDKWIYNIRPPTDDMPYFHDFFKWKSLHQFIDVYGTTWFRKVELGYAVLVTTFILLATIGFLLILLPLMFRIRSLRQADHKWAVLIYFGAIGVAFMFLEIVFIQYFTRFLGDPIFSVAVALTAILVSSGIGSISQEWIPEPPAKRIPLAVFIITLFVLLYLWQLDSIIGYFIQTSIPVRVAISFILISPVSFFMGWMFPNGMELLQNNSESLLPWAWGINGFLSVAASPLAVMLSMSFGFSCVMISALTVYILSATTLIWWS